MLRLDPEIRAMRAQVRAAERLARVEAKKARPKSEKAARGRVRDNGYLAYLRRQPCRVGLVALGRCEGPIQAAHVRYGDASRGKTNPGMQCKPSDRYAVSPCAHHHTVQHSGNERAFWASFRLDGLAEADLQYAAYKAGASATETVRGVG